MVDADGFRPNVGIIVVNDDGRVLWARRVSRNGWQFPQGGIDGSETPEQALYRELHEEVGLTDNKVRILGCTRGWLRYRLPRRMRRSRGEPQFVGQKQKWFLLHLTGSDDDVVVDSSAKPEFDHWQWVSYWYPLSQVIPFKREVYRRALKELAPLVPAGDRGRHRH